MKILILRPAELLEDTLRKFREEGFEAYGCPFVKISYNEFEVPEHDFAIITSQNAARVVVERGLKLGRVIAIGRKTAEILEKAGVKVLIPTKFDSETLFEEFSEMLKGKKVIALRSDAGSKVLKKLAEISDFRDVKVYRIEKLQEEEQRKEIERVKDGFYDTVIFSSSMIARSFLELCDNGCLEALKNMTLIAIGPPTARVLESYGLKPLIPEEYTFDGVLRLLKAIKS